VHVSEDWNCNKLHPRLALSSQLGALIRKWARIPGGWPPLDLRAGNVRKTPAWAPTPRAWQRLPVSTTPHVKSVRHHLGVQSFNVAKVGLELIGCLPNAPIKRGITDTHSSDLSWV